MAKKNNKVLENYEVLLRQANFNISKRIILFDYPLPIFAKDISIEELKRYSGIWVDYESKKVALRAEKQSNLLQLFQKKEEEKPLIFSFSEIQNFEISDDYFDSLSIRVVAGGQTGVTSVVITIYKQLTIMKFSSAGAEQGKGYQICLDCISAMADELNNIMLISR